MEAEKTDQPPWLSAELFPPKPTAAPFGVIGNKGKVSEFSSLEELAEFVGAARNPVAAIWTPDSERTTPMEAEQRLVEALRKRNRRIAEVDFSNARRSGFIFGVVFLWALVAAWLNRGKAPILENQQLGLAALLLFWLALIPLYEAIKLRREAARLNAAEMDATAREARFEFWLTLQKMPFTMVLLAMLAATASAQIALGWSIDWFPSCIKAGILKTDFVVDGELIYEGGYRNGEYWRLWTGALLHGNPVHLAMNGFALWYLGRRAESLARWPHLVMAYLAAMWVGGVASIYLLPDKLSVGASGGIMGLLGFLLVFETLHAKLVPRRARKRLAFAVVIIFLIGAVGWSFIDNAAHAGGMLAGMIYAVVVFPKSSSAHRPNSTRLDIVLGWGGLVILTASVLLALWKIFA